MCIYIYLVMSEKKIMLWVCDVSRVSAEAIQKCDLYHLRIHQCMYSQPVNNSLFMYDM